MPRRLADPCAASQSLPPLAERTSSGEHEHCPDWLSGSAATGSYFSIAHFAANFSVASHDAPGVGLRMRAVAAGEDRLLLVQNFHVKLGVVPLRDRVSDLVVEFL